MALIVCKFLSRTIRSAKTASIYAISINHFDYHITSQLSRCSQFQSPASYHLFRVLTLDAFPQFYSAVYSIRFPESLELLLSMVTHGMHQSEAVKWVESVKLDFGYLFYAHSPILPCRIPHR